MIDINNCFLTPSQWWWLYQGNIEHIFFNQRHLKKKKFYHSRVWLATHYQLSQSQTTLAFMHLHLWSHKHWPLLVENSRAWPLELQVILGTAVSARNQVKGLGLEPLKSSWKPKALVSFTPTITLSIAQPPRGMPETANIQWHKF